VISGKNVFYFNAYAQIYDINEQSTFSLNEADAVKLCDINDEGVVNSIICKIMFTSEASDVSYYKDGKNRTDRMREGVISDGSRTVKITV